MRRRQLRYFLIANSAVFFSLIGAPLAHSSARILPVAPPEPPEFSAPAIRIQTPPSVGRRKAPLRLPEATPLELKRSNALSQPATGMLACAPDPLRPPDINGLGAANQLERLKAHASGTVLPEYQQLPKVRQQRLEANAAWQVGLLTLHGICTVLNTADAARWFERAYSLGEPLALAGLAWCEIDGCKAEANPAAAEKWIALLRPVDRARSEYLQWLVRSRLAPLELPAINQHAPASLLTEQNRQLLANAAKLGDTNAKIEMGLESVSSDNLPQALAYFNSAGARSLAATINSGVMTERLKTTGRVPPPQRPGGVSPGKPQSGSENFAQAQRYHRGQGVPSNYTEAIRLYQLAQNQGNAAAKKMLELIFSRPAPNGQIDLVWMQQLAYIDTSSAVPGADGTSSRQKLKREPTPLFELVPEPWRRYGVATVGA